MSSTGSGRSRSSSPASASSRNSSAVSRASGGSKRSRSRSGSVSSRSRSRSKSRSRSRSRSSLSSRSGSRSSSPRYVSQTGSEGSDAGSVKSAKSGRSTASSEGKGKKKLKAKDRKVSNAMAAKMAANDDDDNTQKGKRSPRKSKAKTQNLDEGEASSDKEFDDGLDEHLQGDEADRARLAELTEKEREEELFKRAENRENLRKRFEIQKKLKLQEKQNRKEEKPKKSSDEELGEEETGEIKDDHDSSYEDYNNVTDAKVRAQDRQKTLDSKRYDKKSDALSQLKAKRQERERKEQERKEKMENQKKEEPSKDQSSDEDSDAKPSKSRRSRSRSSSSASSRRSRRSSSSSSGSASSVDSRRSRKRSPTAKVKYIDNLEDLEPIRLSRFKMERFVHLPFFKKLVIGCYVRIGIGQKQGTPVYRLVEIADVVETAKIYNLGKVRTNSGLKLRFGKDERVYRLEFISNQPPSPSEFLNWKNTVMKITTLPTMDHVKNKSAEIKKAMNYEYTSEDIDKIVAQKERFHRHPKNYAMYKSRLLREKDAALANGEDEKVKDLEEKLNELEERAEELDRKRTSTISTVALINDRNRKANVSKAEAAIRNEINRMKVEGTVSNPFTRRKCQPKIVTKPSKDQELLKSLAAEKENQERMKRQAAEAAASAKANTDVDAIDGEEPTKKRHKGDPKSTISSKEDLFDAHDFDIEIDVDTNVGPTDTTPVSVEPMKPAPLVAKGTGPSKRSLNLDDYKKKRGLI